ncbi:unnamed protein product [Anisakis simplex]|uniref:Subfamily M67C unassigned peptidase (inferred by orthology to a S. mansoni protein) n=1 Tax=Anisakis simplex TaxID=6269 RepID=A0A0M3K6Y2_ANISI|nr:unnamed protein product [Anisakis simplex]
MTNDIDQQIHILESHLDPVERLHSLTRTAKPPDINVAVPINRYYRSLVEMFRIAGHCVQSNEFEAAFKYYMRFVILALEELPKHPDFKTHNSAERTKANTLLRKALECAELLKVRLKETFEKDSIEAQKQIETLKLQQKQQQKLLEYRPKPKPAPRFSDSAISSPSQANQQQLQKEHKLVVAGTLIERFSSIAQKNTDLNIETCAILCGPPISYGVCRITHAVVPKQNGGPDSCDTQNEEEVFAYQDSHNLITLGWIHTHPSQTAFLSSVDLHTQCSYQLMLPEAVAIVIAPKFKEVGVFRLTVRGMEDVGACRVSGFHPHENSNSLFYNEDVYFDHSVDATVVDLRQK